MADQKRVGELLGRYHISEACSTAPNDVGHFANLAIGEAQYAEDWMWALPHLEDPKAVNDCLGQITHHRAAARHCIDQMNAERIAYDAQVAEQPKTDSAADTNTADCDDRAAS